MKIQQFLPIFLSIICFKANCFNCLPLLHESKSPLLTIVGGEYSRAEEANFQVSIQTLSGKHFCGGSIVGSEWIVTAAHCLEGLYPELLKIRYNSLYHNFGGSLSRIKRLIIHPGYDNDTAENDIGLIQTTEQLLENPKSMITKLPEPGVEVPLTAQITVSGWGDTSWNGTISNHLLSVTVSVVDRSICEEIYTGINPVTEDMFCAGELEFGGKDACSGDSGGPAMDEDGILVGLVSWSYSCAKPGFPGVYTQVANYVDWIMENGVTINL